MNPFEKIRSTAQRKKINLQQNRPIRTEKMNPFYKSNLLHREKKKSETGQFGQEKSESFL